MSAAKTMAKPAQFDRSKSRRNSMIGKIMVGQKDLNLHDDDYRQILLDETGEISLKKCNEAQMARVLAKFEQLGFQPLKPKGMASHPMARKARAMWLSLYHLGAVHNPAEKALEAFACRQLGCERMAWARQSDAYRLIEALKAMAERAGWSQAGKPTVRQLQERLAEAVLNAAKDAGMVPADWHLSTAARQICGIEKAMAWSAEDYDEVARALGTELRTYRAKVPS
jgi:phage gp16-like protein